MKTIGLLAAFGPVAGAHFYKRMLDLVAAESDADYPGIVLLSRPDIPDRIDYLLHDGPSPIPYFTRMARQLDALDVDLMAITSATSNVFLPHIQKACRAQTVNLLATVGDEVKRQGARRVGLLATSASVRLRLYEPHMPAASTLVSPPPALQAELDGLIYALKRGEPLSRVATQLQGLINQPWSKTVDAYILGCTELHLAAGDLATACSAIDSVDCLARGLLAAANVRLRG